MAGAVVLDVRDPDDPRIADYLAVRERDLVGRQGRFVAEGAVVLELVAGRMPGKVRSVLFVEARGPRIAPALARLPGVPAYRVPQAVADRIAGFHLNRGILAMVDRPDPPDPEALLAPLAGPAAVPVLAGLSNHDNVGGIFRNAAAFGAPLVAVDEATADPFYRKAIRVSVGGAVLVPHVVFETAEDAVRRLAALGFAPVGLTPRPDAPSLHGAPLPARAALLLGAEGPGLSGALLAAVERRRIPMAPGFDSLNVAVAAGIALSRHHALHGLPVRTASAPARG